MPGDRIPCSVPFCRRPVLGGFQHLDALRGFRVFPRPAAGWALSDFARAHNQPMRDVYSAGRAGRSHRAAVANRDRCRAISVAGCSALLGPRQSPGSVAVRASREECPGGQGPGWAGARRRDGWPTHDGAVMKRKAEVIKFKPPVTPVRSAAMSLR